ncbi:WD40/YVTN/BNR-like repeat-containing protein [Hymenobacter metallicola]|nr:YCF48-related protein [Hymenobacter metallicola]
MRFENLPVPAAAAGQDLLTVDFISATQGFVGGNQGTLLTTTDGGQSWQNRSRSSLGDIRKLVFNSATTGWAGTSTGLYRTADGGQSWTLVNYSPTYDIQFVNSQVGYAVGSQNSILRTSNGGQSWVAQNAYNWYPRLDLHAVSFTSVDSGVAMGAERSRYQTTDGGQSWQRDSHGSLTTIYDVIRYRNGRGFVRVGEPQSYGDSQSGFEDAYLVGSTPTSSFWSSNYAWPNNTFAVYGLAQWQNRIVAVGNSTIIRQHREYATHDSPWVQVLGPDATTIRNNYHAADFSTADTFYAVGEKGLVSRFHYN